MRHARLEAGKFAQHMWGKLHNERQTAVVFTCIRGHMRAQCTRVLRCGLHTKKSSWSSLRGALPRDAASARPHQERGRGRARYASTTPLYCNTRGIVLHGERVASGAAPGWEAGRSRPRRCPLVPGPRLPVGSPEGSAGRRAAATATTLLGRSPCLPSWRGGHFKRTTITRESHMSSGRVFRRYWA